MGGRCSSARSLAGRRFSYELVGRGRAYEGTRTHLSKCLSDTIRVLRIYGGGRGLQVEPLVVSVAALQPSQRPKRSHARANDCRGDSVECYGFEEVPPRDQSLAGDILGGSRATGRALGCLRSGETGAGLGHRQPTWRATRRALGGGAQRALAPREEWRREETRRRRRRGEGGSLGARLEEGGGRAGPTEAGGWRRSEAGRERDRTRLRREGSLQRKSSTPRRCVGGGGVGSAETTLSVGAADMAAAATA